MSNVLASKDVNTSITGSAAQDSTVKGDIKSMEYHRQVLQNKIEQGQYVTRFVSHTTWMDGLLTTEHRGQTYISPSDNIMSPCTAKLSAFRSKQVGKYVIFPETSPLPLFSRYLTV
jgi:hypothetical protein